MHLRVAAFKLSYFATVPGINRMILQRLCIRRLSFTCRETKLGSYITESPKNAPRKTMINAAGMKTEDTHNLGRVNLQGFSSQPYLKYEEDVLKDSCLCRRVKTLQMFGNRENLTPAM